MESPTPYSPGRRIGKYEIGAFIGRGGMATVHRARLLGPARASKEVALKLFHRHLSLDSNFVLMFLDEMRVAMALSHRNIVQTFDADKDQHNDTYFMVMELVDGCSAGQLLQLSGSRSSLPLDVAVFIGMEVCAALDYAHNLQAVPGTPAGVIHRDLSPGNILISRQGDVKLADFGVAKVAGNLSTTAAHAIKGKLDYMAPEQAQGQVTHHSDLFALGAVIYELIGGQGIRSDPSLDAVRAYNSAPLPLSALRPEMPASLEERIMRCLSRAPGDRPSSARMLRQQLRQEHEHLLQEEGGIDPDPHARLQAYLAPLLASRSLPSASDDPAARLARAMFEQIKELPADPEVQAVLTQAPPQHTPLAVPTLAPAAATTGEQPATSSDAEVTIDSLTRPGRLPLLVAGVVILVLLVVGGIALWPTRDEITTQTDLQVLAAAPSRDASLHATRIDAEPISPDLSLPIDLTTPPDLPGSVVPDLETPSKKQKPRWRRWRPKKHAVRHSPGRLYLNTQPWTSVYVDGKHVGATPIQGLKLPAGKHRIRMVNTKQKVSQTITVRVRAGRTLRKVIVLH